MHRFEVVRRRVAAQNDNAADPLQARIRAVAESYEQNRRLSTASLIPLLDHEASEVRASAADALGTILAPHDDSRALQALARASERDPLRANREQIERALQRAFGV